MMRDGDPVSSSRCERCLRYFRSAGTFLFSHIGLFSLVVGYTIMGAFAFEALEANEERGKKRAMRERRGALVERLWGITEHMDVLHEANWTELTLATLKEFEGALAQEVKRNGYDGADEDDIQWTFSGALLYSLIVITTIGYGNVAPKTAWGRMVTILYAVVGIPLMLFCMSNIGDTMAQSFKFVYWKLCCYFCIRSRRQQQRRQAARNARYHRYPSTRSRPGSSRHSSTRSNDGSGYYGAPDATEDDDASFRRRLAAPPLPPPPVHNQPHEEASGAPPDVSKVPVILNKYVLESEEDLRVDLPPSPLRKDGFAVACNHQEAPPRPPQRMASMEPLRRHSSRRKHYQQGRHLDPAEEYECSDAYELEEQQEELESKEQVTVPIWLCCALVTGYIGGGGVLFSFWEGWGFLDASYFCFVTLTTIGFGDLVPGKAVIHDDSQPTLALCALYLLFGMALLAMSFNLVQEQVTTAVKSIGRRIGIVDDEDDEDDMDEDDDD